MRRVLVPAVATLACLAGSVLGAASATADDATLTISVSSPRQVDHPVAVTGSLSSGGQPVADQMVTCSRTDPDGQTSTFDLQPTDSTGAYGCNDGNPGPDQRGQVVYTVTWPGDASDPNGATAQQTVTVTGLTPTLTLTSGKRVVDSGRMVHLTVHLATGPANRHVTLYATPYRRSRHQVAAGDVDAASGDLSASYRMQRRTRFQAVFGGDSRYDAATAALVVRARGVLTERLSGGYGRSGGYRLYRADGSPKLTAALTPKMRGFCLRFRAQRRAHGAWHTSDLSSCLRTNRRGEAAGKLLPPHVTGTPYRVRAEWRGNRTALATNGRWLKLKFHR